LIVGLILFETLLDFITYRLAPRATDHPGSRERRTSSFDVSGWPPSSQLE
jgi:hypothetical protein